MIFVREGDKFVVKVSLGYKVLKHTKDTKKISLYKNSIFHYSYLNLILVTSQKIYIFILYQERVELVQLIILDILRGVFGIPEHSFVLFLPLVFD